MRKYQEPQMNILDLENEDIITTSGGTLEDIDGPGGSGTGGTDNGDWGDFWN